MIEWGTRLTKLFRLVRKLMSKKIRIWLIGSEKSGRLVTLKALN